ncbi:hypothetical protein ANRL1_04304 [Anaerolineae bacterium]|nr:hypothetical protein ANRL1_04304 [Anaerolineae bacterium]
MDLVFIVLTLVFFALSWAFVKLCERLSDGGQNTSARAS